MKTRTLLMVLFTVFTFAFSTFAKEKQESYNMRRAMECAYALDFESALEYLEQEITDNPKNAKAYDLLGYIYEMSEENGKALTAFNKALSLYPKKDKDGRARTHYLRGQLYLQMCDTVPAISDLEMAVSLNPADEDYLSELAMIYSDKERYDDAEAIFNRMIALDAGNSYPLYYLAINAMWQDKYDVAQNYIDRVRKLDVSPLNADILEMRNLLLQLNYLKALEKAIDVLSVKMNNEEAYDDICYISDFIYPETVARFKKAAFEDRENSNLWKLCLGSIYHRHGKYEDAIACYLEIEEDPDFGDIALNLLIDCYNELGYLDKAEETANILLERYPDDADLLLKRADARFFAQRLDEAEADYRAVMELDPDYGYFCFYRLGWIEEMRGNYEKALENYDMSIILEEDYAYSYMMKGMLLLNELNRPEEGREALRLCIEKDAIEEEGSSMQYAYAALGERDKAVEIMDSIIALNPDNFGNYYDAACVYCRLGEKDNALKNLRIALEKGYRKLNHIKADNDMDLIRDTPEFQELIEEFDQPLNAPVKTESKPRETVYYEIPIEKDFGNTYQIKATVNGLPMNFTLDTGASDVSISQVEYEYMLKNGYIKKSDLRGIAEYSNANGESYYNQQLNISKICIGDVEVNNIRASIVPNQHAPLLLGQSVLTKFGKMEIDHENKVLRITTTK